METNLLKALPELVEAGIIDQPAADRIRAYAEVHAGSSTQRIYTVFGILGAVLVGLGIVLVVAHNWDGYSWITRTVLAVLPMLAGQALCVYVLFRRNDEPVWREGSSAFLFFAVGAAISLLSQIYQLSGDLDSFLMTWMLLTMPLIFILRASVTSLLYLCGITWYFLETADTNRELNPAWYWLLLLPVLGHYYQLYVRSTAGNALYFHHWLVPFSVTMAIAMTGHNAEFLLLLVYGCLSSLYCLLGSTAHFSPLRIFPNGYRVIGSVGLVFLTIMMSFHKFWERLYEHDIRGKSMEAILLTREMAAVLILTAMIAGAGYLVYLRPRPRPEPDLHHFGFVAIAAAFVLTCVHTAAATVLINLFVLALGLLSVIRGIRDGGLAMMNYGLLVVAILIGCRFFDLELSFTARGVLFIVLGAGFFLANYIMLRNAKRKATQP